VGRATANARWAFLGLGVKVAVQGIVGFYVLRIVGTDTAGVMGIGITYVALTALLLDQGMGQALIRAKEITHSEIATVQVTTLCLAIGTGIVTAALAVPLGHFFNFHDLPPLLTVLGAGLILRTPSIPGQAVLQREFQFRWLAGCDMASSVLGMTASVVTALNHGGALSLAAQVLVTDAVYTIGVVRRSGMPFRGATMADLRGMLGFTSQIAGSQWLGFLSRNVDNILIGRVLGKTALGNYSLSYRLMMLPITNLTMVANRVLLPTYSRLQDNLAGFRRSFLRSCKLMSLTSTPLMALLVVFASPLILGALKAQYRGAILPTQVLAGVAIIQAQTSLITPAIVAFGRTAWQLKWMLISTVLTVAMFGGTVHWGLNAVCIGYLVLNVLTLPFPILLVGRLGGFSLGDWLRSVAPGLGIGAIMLGIGAAVRLGLEPLGTPELLVGLGGGALSALIAVPVVRIAMPRSTLELLSLASRGSKKAKPGVEITATPAVAS
jgi:O-antigen/teichoic acid export membrane protein